MNRIDKKGHRFGRLVAILQTDKRTKSGNVYWLCQCDCGKTTLVSSDHLRKNGGTQSCGCLQIDKTIISHLKHGFGARGLRHRAYQSWRNMIARCINPDNPAYKYYGGRGITVCKRWRKFTNFYSDMGYPPFGLTLERINNDGNYKRSNCKWATRKEQNKNKRGWGEARAILMTIGEREEKK